MTSGMILKLTFCLFVCSNVWLQFLKKELGITTII